ncbi:shikimate dehydrogenase [Nitriliruptoraceae bacterium ZYF776]|nr:shikimate dehydrogenase [Profundirhabdus halotolerans]
MRGRRRLRGPHVAQLRAPWPTAHTRVVGLLGWPVRHSVSPAMHNAAFREQRLDLVYVALPTPADQLGGVVAALGAVGAVGANVTVPHKVAVRELCDTLTDEAALVGAVNTLAWTTDGLVGDNTDAVGLADALTADGAAAADDEVVLFGTGGAARAAAVATGRLGCRVQVVGRRPDAAEELANLAERAGAPAVGAVPLDELARVRDVVARARTVVNATPLGMGEEELPEPFTTLAKGQVAYDLVYTPPETPFLAAARSRGAQSHHGLGMLVGQAAASYRRWTAREAPVATMSAAAISALFGSRDDDA